MPQCAAGRGITHADAEKYPGFQSPCPDPATIAILLGGSRADFHDLCSDHLRALARHGLVELTADMRAAR